VLASTALMEVDRESATTDGLRDEAVELGIVGAREGGCCWRMRRNPVMPGPCSWSLICEALHVEINPSVSKTSSANDEEQGWC
jgi:hypothetical protein